MKFYIMTEEHASKLFGLLENVSRHIEDAGNKYLHDAIEQLDDRMFHAIVEKLEQK